MATQSIEIVGSFTAYGSDGQQYTVINLQDVFQHNSSEGRNRVAGNQWLALENGMHVNRIDKGKYLIVELEIQLTSDDPTAP